MYTTRAEMKIFATNAVGASPADAVATAAGATPTTTTQAQQQRDFRCVTQLKFNKYNNNKAGNILRHAKYNNNNSNNNNNNNNNNNTSENKNSKRHQQQQQIQQQQQQHENYNHFARRKYYGNNNNNTNNNNSYNCNQQQQQSLYFTQQQQQQHYAAEAATSKLNNNNTQIKNQNLINDINGKHSNDNNNNNKSSGNSNNSTSNTNNAANKLHLKSSSNINNNNNNNNSSQNNNNSSNNNNNNCNKKRNAHSSSAESSTSTSYYRSCSESSSTAQTAATSNSNNSRISNNSNTSGSSNISASSTTHSNKNKEDTCKQQQQQQYNTPTTLNEIVAATANKPSTATVPQEDNISKSQRPKQQPPSFWKTIYQQQPTLQQKEQQLEAALATQKETELALAAAAAAATPITSAATGDQQPHYYPYYYSHPKQLTIASFLQKELLPNADKASQQQQQQHQQQHHQQQQQHKQQHKQHQQQVGGYQQRYRNGSYAYNNYQQHQQQQHAAYQSQSQQQAHAHNHNNNMHSSQQFRRNNKKLQHVNGNNSTAATAQKSIEMASNFNATTHRRIQNAAAGSAANNSGNMSAKSAFYQMRAHHYNALMSGNGSAISSDRYNFYNLTYVNMDVDVPPPPVPPQSTTAGTPATVTSVDITTLPSILLKPPPTAASTTTTTAAVNTTLPAAAMDAAASATNAATAAVATERNMFMQPPPALQLAMLSSSIPTILTPDNVATTPTNMISCAQLDEAITAAAACSTGKNVIAKNNRNLEQLSAVMTVHSPSYATLPLLVQQQQQQQQQQQLLQQSNTTGTQQQLFFGFTDSYPNNAAVAWSHSNSPCYAAAYGPSPSSISSSSVHSCMPSQRAVSPASSTCSLASESQWSNRSRLTSTEFLSVSPVPGATAPGSATAAQLSPHLATSPHHHHHVGNINTLHGMLPFSLPPPPLPPVAHNPAYPHYCGPNCGCNGITTWPASWYELVLPPDRYLDHARNVELTVQPEQLLCHTKYDNLSLDIWKRFRAAQQTHTKFKLKMRLWRYLFIWINPMLSRYRICLVGSTITGFGTDSSDIDMCLLPEHPSHQHLHQHQYHNEQRAEALTILNLFNTVLKEMVYIHALHVGTEAFQDFNLIEARVPILRFKDRINGIEVDLNFNNSVGIKNTYLLQLYAQLDWRTRPLVVIVKLWAQYHDINDAKRMTVSSYSLVLMVLHYLQHGCVPHVLPCLQALYPEKFNLGQQDCLDLDLIEPIEPYQTHNTQTLGEHLLGFFKYYSNFDFRNNAISIRTGGILPVAACRLAKSPKNDIHQWKELNIEEPFDFSNTARSVYDYATFERVKAIFVASARRLEHTLDLNSVFTPIHYTQRPPMLHQTGMHVLAHAAQTHLLSQQPHQHLLHARQAAPTTPSAKIVTAGNFVATA